MNKNNLTNYIAITALLILGVATRFLPHNANFTSIGAIALFGGLYLPKRWAIIGPMLAMFVSDIFIGFYSLPIMISVYLGFAITTLIGLKIRNQKTFAKIAGGTIAGSLLFFLITNFAVWAFGTMYVHNFTGLIQSYYMALPFLKNSLAGDLFYSTILIGGYELLSVLLLKRKVFCKV